MNTTQINCFLEAAKVKSFSKAASNLYISQPTFSRNISQLEEELGFQLFQRSSFHGTELTEAGRIMQKAVLSAKKLVDSAQEEALRTEAGTKSHLTIGLLEGQLLDDRLENLLVRFRLAYQNTDINIRRSNYAELMIQLQSGEVDLVYMPSWQYTDKEDLTFRYIGDMETWLVAPKRLIPRVEDRIYSLKEFQSYPFITVGSSESTVAVSMIRDLFRSESMNAPIRESDTIREQIEKVEMGEGLILINRNNFICFSPNVHCIKVKELKPQPFAIAWKESGSSAGIRLFRRFLENANNTHTPIP